MRMGNKGWVLALVFLARAGAQGAGAQAGSENLIRNPGFESNQDWWGFDTSFGAATGTISFDDPGAVHEGSKGARIAITEIDGENWHVQLQCPPQFEAVLNSDYHLSFWGRTHSPDGKPVHVAIQDGAPDYTYRTGQSFQLDTTWQQFDVYWTSDVEGLEMLRFNLYLGGDTGTYYFDDFSLTATAPPVSVRRPGPEGIRPVRKGAALPAVGSVDVAGRAIGTGRKRGGAGITFNP